MENLFHPSAIRWSFFQKRRNSTDLLENTLNSCQLSKSSITRCSSASYHIFSLCEVTNLPFNWKLREISLHFLQSPKKRPQGQQMGVSANRDVFLLQTSQLKSDGKKAHGSKLFTMLDALTKGAVKPTAMEELDPRVFSRFRQ